MNVLLVYGTLSGSTMTVAELIASTLRAGGHTVDVVTADSATKELVQSHDYLIVGSPSWEDAGKDGQPLPEVTAFLSGLTAADLTGKKVALFGLGDIAYPHFCGAVDIMEEKLKAMSVSPAVEPLRIDRYYSFRENEQKVKDWATKVSSLTK